MGIKNNYAYFANRECQYFPCHKTAAGKGEFNCLFCYCPLYALGERFGGNFTYTEAGIKDCSNCLLPHIDGGYDYITLNFKRIVDMIKNQRR